MKAMMQKTRHRRKAQSLVEFALGGMLLFMFLAAAVDFGRVYYTYIVVENMAGEGASYVSQTPDADYYLNSGLPLNDTFQGRAIDVATRIMGGVIDRRNVKPPTGTQPSSGPPAADAGDVVLTDRTNHVIAAADRCRTAEFTLRVSYHMNDLFFPGILGMSQITITAQTDGVFVNRSSACS
jgi:hypothetical protein